MGMLCILTEGGIYTYVLLKTIQLYTLHVYFIVDQLYLNKVELKRKTKAPLGIKEFSSSLSKSRFSSLIPRAQTQIGELKI